MRKFNFYFYSAVLALACLTACGGSSGSQPTFEYMPNMMDNIAVKPQEEKMRSPVPGTVPTDFSAYPYTAEQGDQAASLQNPLKMTKENLLSGQKHYNNTCIVCHGPTGKGDGSIVPKFPAPPTLHSDKVRNWSDGRIFHVATKGQNRMGPYESQLFPEERWAIVLYVRALQRAVDPTAADVEAYKQLLKK